MWSAHMNLIDILIGDHLHDRKTFFYIQDYERINQDMGSFIQWESGAQSKTT